MFRTEEIRRNQNVGHVVSVHRTKLFIRRPTPTENKKNPRVQRKNLRRWVTHQSCRRQEEDLARSKRDGSKLISFDSTSNTHSAPPHSIIPRPRLAPRASTLFPSPAANPPVVALGHRRDIRMRLPSRSRSRHVPLERPSLVVVSLPPPFPPSAPVSSPARIVSRLAVVLGPQHHLRCCLRRGCPLWSSSSAFPIILSVVDIFPVVTSRRCDVTPPARPAHPVSRNLRVLRKD